MSGCDLMMVIEKKINFLIMQLVGCWYSLPEMWQSDSQSKIVLFF